MKKQISILCLHLAALIFLCTINSCSKTSPANACLNSTPSTASVGASVTFSSCTSGASSYSWNFGDGSSGSGQTASHTYTTAGTYTGSLTVTNGGSTASKSFTITVVANNWSFKGTSFVADSVTASSSADIMAAYATSGNTNITLDIIFGRFPTASGSYTVVNAASNNPSAGQLYVTLYDKVGTLPTIYGSTGSGPVTATVTVSGGKIAITLPTMELVNQGNASDSTTFSGTITQTQ